MALLSSTSSVRTVEVALFCGWQDHEQKCCGGQQIDGILATLRVLEMSASCLVFRLLLSCLPWLDLFVRLVGGFLARQHLGLDSEGFLLYFHGHGVAIINLLYLTIN